ncbi:MAG: glycosyltransferase [Kaistella sp.]|nr:glycosyltransferase [Kaistella sp.]
MIKHSVLVVTYNQEDFIQETISSLLNQSEMPYEIIILDDCSTDRNWDIILQNQKKHPDLIKAVRNEVNLGLFPNVKKIRDLYTGNVVSFCAGDDLLEPDTIRDINKKIIQEDLDGEKDRFIIVTNSVHLYPDGTRTIWNNYIERNVAPIKTRLRYGLSYRAVGLSRALLKSTITDQEYAEQNPEVGYTADFLKGFDEILKADRMFFINTNGGVYRLNVGVTSAKTDKKWREHQAAYKAIREIYKNKFDAKDQLFIDFIIAGDQYKIEPTVGNWIKATYYFIMNTGNFSYNNPMVRNLHYLMPYKVVEWLKFNVYPVFLKWRNAVSSK